MVQDIETARHHAQGRRESRVPAEHRYPTYDLEESLIVARAIRDEAGGACTRDQLASFLNYSTTNSGSFLSRIAAARIFGLIERSGRDFVPTQLAIRILNPEWPEDAIHARVEAFMSVPLYQTIYERYEGQQLPPEAGFRNALQTHYNIPPNRTGLAYRVLMDSAEQAQFFATRGARSHLVQPVVPRPGIPAEAGEAREGGGPGWSPPPPPPPSTTDAEQVRLEYIRKLIAMLGTEEVEQSDLMERIERLLGKKEEITGL